MNYLAHIYLSATPQEQLGNFIGDFVKGRQYEHYPSEVRNGILRHRAIDELTDLHPAVQQARALLRAPFGRYAGIVLDLYFDHFLAVRFRQYTGIRLTPFACRFYCTLWRYRRLLPERVRGFMWHFILTNRLCRYATFKGLHRSLAIMVRYKPLPIDPKLAITFLQEHYDELEECFRQLWERISKTYRHGA